MEAPRPAVLGLKGDAIQEAGAGMMGWPTHDFRLAVRKANNPAGLSVTQ